MSNWEAKRLSDVVHGIDQGAYVLPVIQRRLVWNEDKMELLFDSLLKGNSFGGIMVLEEQPDTQPLFAFRSFSKNGEDTFVKPEGSLQQLCHLVIDGQQRLQAFYMGLLGSFNQKILHFDLLSTDSNYDYRFASDPGALPKTVTNDAEKQRVACWYSAPALFSQLQRLQDHYEVTTRITQKLDIKKTDDIIWIQRNIYQFQLAVFITKAIGTAIVTVKKDRIEQERIRIVELFRRLNDGGTRLSSFDLVASMFKGFDHRMERFFYEVQEFRDIYFDQDEMIKLIFLLQNEHTREVTQVTAQDADFAVLNQERIFVVLRTVRTFLKQSGLYNYFSDANRSAIPLYFIAYHLFHKDISTLQLSTVYDNFDTNNPDFVCLKRWIYLSLLNGVFSRGSGWIPYKTGIRKILTVLKNHRGKIFPVEPIFDLYRGHPLTFTSQIEPNAINSWDRDFLFYLIYDGNSISGRDIDHIQPRSLLEQGLKLEGDSALFSSNEIHSVANYQLLDPGTNRNIKRAKALNDWLNNENVLDTTEYCQRHLIPMDADLRRLENFHDFLAYRRQTIVDRVIQTIPISLLPPPEPDLPTPPDKAADMEEASMSSSPALFPMADTTWKDFFDKAGCGKNWASRYSIELRAVGIVTLDDFARIIQERGLVYVGPQKHGKAYRFVRPGADGNNTQPETNNFGGWGWITALKCLQDHGFEWKQYLVDIQS